jgi:RNA polymerase-interacting CarD/CdnL/TRCF family regulator
MKLKVGTKVIYPSQGPCLIHSIVEKEIAGHAVSFYQLRLLDESGGDLFVPVARAQASGLRNMLSESELAQVLNHFNQPASAAKDWKQRASENTKRLASGSALELAEVVKSLTELSAHKELSFAESRVLDKARKLLISELAEVLHETRKSAEARLDEALSAPALVDSDGSSLKFTALFRKAR